MMESNASEAIICNVMGTKLLADISVSVGVKRFVMISTDKAVNPTNVMIIDVRDQRLWHRIEGVI